ncbi:endonuclease V [Salinisphaera sp. USBA-960]|uniref:endonuclease V n=1 Tax=Salinisphaera orenii TaxID=856731 RepID=UPI000DBEA0E9|nr:endonuclease V [Salifodinibacter halophilus]NNC25961.1 endonuclease V [Salifodinibacter halophilus]
MARSTSNQPRTPPIQILSANAKVGRRICHDWPTQAATCRALQDELAAHVDPTPRVGNVQWIAGVDVGFPRRGRQTLAAVVVLEAQTRRIAYSARAAAATRMPYIPGLLSFRELPTALAALASLPVTPDLLMVDGQGIAHPRRVGTASHLGLVTGLPSIGVGKSRLSGHYQPPTDPGQVSLLQDEQSLLGHVLKTRERANPLFISPGDGMDSDTALAWVRSTLAGRRLPEPTRLADALTRDH